jgi:hypothetical protein
MAFGAGSSIGHRIVDMLSFQKPAATLTLRDGSPAALTRLEEYEQCMKKYEQVGGTPLATVGDDTVCEKILSKN